LKVNDGNWIQNAWIYIAVGTCTKKMDRMVSS